MIKPSLQSSASLLSIEQKKPAFVELFTAENVKLMKLEVVVVSLSTGSPFPSIADVIIVSRGSSGITFQTHVAGVVSNSPSGM